MGAAQSEREFANGGIGLARVTDDIISTMFPHVLVVEHQAWRWLNPEGAVQKYTRYNVRGSITKYMPALRLGFDFVRDEPHKAEDHEAFRRAQEVEQARKERLAAQHGVALVSIYPGDELNPKILAEKIEAARAMVDPNGSPETTGRPEKSGVAVVDRDPKEGYGFLPR